MDTRSRETNCIKRIAIKSGWTLVPLEPLALWYSSYPAPFTLYPTSYSALYWLAIRFLLSPSPKSECLVKCRSIYISVVLAVILLEYLLTQPAFRIFLSIIRHTKKKTDIKKKKKKNFLSKNSSNLFSPEIFFA